jgi:SAM-dependent methyltransferase
MTQSSDYNSKFYRGQSGGSAASAKAIVPTICELTKPKSVLDVGCGIGAWGLEFKRNGVADVCGIDGPWVDKSQVLLSREEFVAFDFLSNEAPPPQLPREKFDLVVSFEVLEHIEKSKAESLVRFMTSKTDVVIAGAAPPGQGGRNHVNEQWPEYWVQQFAKFGFVAFDILRPLLWHTPHVEPPYVQNSIMYFRGSVPQTIKERGESIAISALGSPRSIIHPAMFLHKANKLEKLRRRSVSGIFKRIFRGRR